MICGNLEIEMLSHRQFSRINTVELKSKILKQFGLVKAEKYFYHLKRFLCGKLSKPKFDKLCCSTIGRENVALHNLFIRSILSNACFAHTPPARESNTGHSRNSVISNGSLGDTFPASPHKGRSVNSHYRKFKDRPSPLGPYGKMLSGNAQEISSSCDLQGPREQQGALELISVGSKALLEVGSVEDGEEVEQVRGSPGVQSRSPIRAPLGIPMSVGGVCRKAFRNGPAGSFHLPMTDIPENCCSCSELPDSRSLRRRLERKVELEGLVLSGDCVNLLNNGLDIFLKRLIKPCMDLARARCSNEQTNRLNGKLVPGMNCVSQREYLRRSNQSCCASLLDFRVAMESNSRLLGEDGLVKLEKICMRASEE